MALKDRNLSSTCRSINRRLGMLVTSRVEYLQLLVSPILCILQTTHCKFFSKPLNHFR